MDRHKLAQVISDLVHEDTRSWFCEAELLLSAGMTLQSMDVSLGQKLEQQLGSLTIDEKKVAIAEFHRQVLKAMGLPVPPGDLEPDPLWLPIVHEAVPYRTTGRHGSLMHQFSQEEGDALVALVERERPELIAHYRADLERWVTEGRPRDDYRGRSQFAGNAIQNLILAFHPELENAEASRGVSEVIVRINAPYL